MSRLSYDPVEGARRYWLEQGWDDAAAGVAGAVSVMRGWQIILNRANQLLRPFDLTLLGLLRPGWQLPLGQVGAGLWITPGTVTSSVDRLEAAELIRRVPHPDDGRTVLAEITPKGRKVFDKAVGELNAHLFSTLPLTEVELTQLVRLLNKIRAEAGDTVTDDD